MRVERARSAVRMLSCFGSRCWIRTSAIPVSAGNFCNSLVNASSPTADAPIPTTGKDATAAAEAEGFFLRGIFLRAGIRRTRFFAMLYLFLDMSSVGAYFRTVTPLIFLDHCLTDHHS